MLLGFQDGPDTVCHGVDTLNTETQEVRKVVLDCMISLPSSNMGSYIVFPLRKLQILILTFHYYSFVSLNL